LINRKSIRIFLISFWIALVLTCFLLALFWVQLKAADGGFGSLAERVKIEKSDQLHYTFTAGEFDRQIDLTPIDRAAEVMQQYERWIFPHRLRIFSKTVCFTAQQIKDSQRQAREQEFFRNAGLV